MNWVNLYNVVLHKVYTLLYQIRIIGFDLIWLPSPEHQVKLGKTYNEKVFFVDQVNLEILIKVCTQACGNF